MLGYDNLRIYGKDYKDKLESVGFNVNVIDYASELDEKTIYKQSLSKEAIWYCKKI